MIISSSPGQTSDQDGQPAPELGAGDAQFSDDILVKQQQERIVGNTTHENDTDEVPPTTIETHLLDLEVGEIKSITVNTSNAAIDIEPHDAAQIIVTAEGNEPFATTALEVRAKEKSVSISFQHRRLAGLVWKTQPSVRLKIKVPRYFSATVLSKSGEVSVSDLTGSVSVRSSTGDVTLQQLSGNLRVESTSGNIEGQCPSASMKIASRSGNINIKDLSGSLTCRAMRGDTTLEWKISPSNAKINIRSDHRPVTLIMPPETNMNYRFITSATAIMNEFPQFNDSNLFLRIISKRGPLSIRKRL